MKRVTQLAIGCLGFALCCLGQSPSDLGRRVPTAYELYSWQDTNARWRFCLLPSPSGVNLSAEQVFSKKCVLSGVKQLKQKMSGSPEGTTIYWLDRIVGTSQETR